MAKFKIDFVSRRLFFADRGAAGAAFQILNTSVCLVFSEGGPFSHISRGRPRVVNSVVEIAAPKPKKVATVSSSRACGNCGALEDPSDAALSACARCHLVFYCSKPCQVQHWKQKPAGHKQFCLTPEERQPADAEDDKSKLQFKAPRYGTWYRGW